MALLRGEKDFADAIEVAASKLGLQPQFVEKDYWVTATLKSLQVNFPGGFLFKGGTSLSKGYGLIERFSEDVDILVTPTHGHSNRDRERRLLEIAETIANDLALERDEYRLPGRGKDAHRADLLKFAAVSSRTIETGIEHDGVLLETGYQGGREPARMVEISAILCEPAGIQPGEYEDLEPFDVPALEPVRTLVEKLAGMHHLAHSLLDAAGPDAPDAPDAASPDIPDEVSPDITRCGRHYWDIDRLLDDADVRKALSDREAYAELVADVEKVSARHFGGCSPRPEEGYAYGPAFSPPDEIRTTLEARYGEAALLLPTTSNAKWPSFGKTLERIHRHADLI